MVNIPATEIFDGWKQIYVLTDLETDRATEKDWGIRLLDFLQQHDTIRYYLSPDERIVHAVDKASSKVLYSYVLEDSWSPSVRCDTRQM